MIAKHKRQYAEINSQELLVSFQGRHHHGSPDLVMMVLSS
jgi:hypothetical protein